jgi:hypothetical protein
VFSVRGPCGDWITRFTEYHQQFNSVLGRRQPREVCSWRRREDLTCELKTLCVIITVIFKVLQLIVVTTSAEPINPITNPNPRLSHPYTWQYVTCIRRRLGRAGMKRRYAQSINVLSFWIWGMENSESRFWLANFQQKVSTAFPPNFRKKTRLEIRRNALSWGSVTKALALRASHSQRVASPVQRFIRNRQKLINRNVTKTCLRFKLGQFIGFILLLINRNEKIRIHVTSIYFSNSYQNKYRESDFDGVPTMYV